MTNYCNAIKSGSSVNKTKQPSEEWEGQGYCKEPAGWGTDHKGRGRCRHHDGRPVEHGYYSKYLEDSVGEALDELSESDDILELRKTIAAQQKVLMDLLDEMGDGETDPEKASLISKIADQIGKNRKRLHSIEEGEKLTIHVEEVHRVVKMVVKVVKDETDNETAKKVGKRLKDQIKL